jgi:hypothetical protein
MPLLDKHRKTQVAVAAALGPAEVLYTMVLALGPAEVLDTMVLALGQAGVVVVAAGRVSALTCKDHSCSTPSNSATKTLYCCTGQSSLPRCTDTAPRSCTSCCRTSSTRRTPRSHSPQVPE